MFYNFARVVLYVFIHIMFRIRFEGRENVPKEGGFLLAANHRSYYDPIFVALMIRPHLHFMAKEELFHKNIIFTKIIQWLGAIPVIKGDDSTLSGPEKVLNSGGAILIFPEGHRSKDGIPLRGRNGAAVLAANTGADVMAVSIDFGKKLSFRSKVTITFHPMLKNEDLDISMTSPASLKAATKTIMQTIESGLYHLPELKEEVAKTS